MNVLERPGTHGQVRHVPGEDAWWLPEFERIAAHTDPVERARLATRAITQSAAFRDHCSALRDVAIREALETPGVRQKDLANALEVSEPLVSTVARKVDVEGSKKIVRNALRRAARLRL